MSFRALQLTAINTGAVEYERTSRDHASVSSSRPTTCHALETDISLEMSISHTESMVALVCEKFICNTGVRANKTTHTFRITRRHSPVVQKGLEIKTVQLRD